MTVTVKAMASQRWNCRIHLFQFKGPPVKMSLKRMFRPSLTMTDCDGGM